MWKTHYEIHKKTEMFNFKYVSDEFLKYLKRLNIIYNFDTITKILQGY